MQFKIEIPKVNGEKLDIVLDIGQSLFLLGANGSGKSSLVSKLARENLNHTLRISAHRQTWFEKSSVTMTPQHRRELEGSMREWNQNVQSRHIEQGASQKTQVAIFDLINAENIIARKALNALKNKSDDEAKNIAKQPTPIEEINELLRLSNLPIEISIKDNEHLVATKNGSPHFSTAKMSDGERNAMLISASVLTAKSGTIIFIDEPERHLHRSVISPLLSNLFSRKQDCAFVISTHDPMLPIDCPESKTVLIRGCNYTGDNASSWDIDLLEPRQDINDEVKREIFGSRRKLLFVEGTEASLDKPLYSIIFPMASVISKTNCRDVIDAVSSIRMTNDLHWLKAFGIIDCDNRNQQEIEKLRSKHIYPLPVHSVESIYYHPEIQRLLARRYMAVIGGEPDKALSDAKELALESANEHSRRLCEKAVEREVRQQIFQKLPHKVNFDEKFLIEIDVNNLINQELKIFKDAYTSKDFQKIIERYPVRETPSLKRIAQTLGFQSTKQYESAVLRLLIDDASAIQFVRELVQPLYSEVTKE